MSAMMERHAQSGRGAPTIAARERATESAATYTVVALTVEDLERVAEETAGQRVLALTPAARHLALERGIACVGTLDVFKDSDHARCVAASIRAIRTFDRIGAGRLSSAAEVLGRQAVWNVASIAWRLHRTVRVFPVRVCDAKGTWIIAANSGEMLDALLPRILDAGVGRLLGAQRAPLHRLHQAMTRLVARIVMPRGPRIVTPGAHLKIGFDKALQDAGFELCRLESTSGTSQDWIALINFLACRTQSLRVSPLGPDDPALAKAMDVMAEVGASFANSTMSRAWEIYRPKLAGNLAVAMGLAQNARNLLVDMDAVAVASYEANGWPAAALFDAGSRAARPTIALSHNFHTMTGSTLGNAVIGLLHRQRKHTSSTRVTLDWSPGDATFAQLAGKRLGYTPASLACHLYAPSPPPPDEGTFRILYAANYQNWTDFFPWIAETSDEFLGSIERLCEAVEAVKGVKLTLRIRPKAEVDLAVIRRVVRPSPNVEVCSVDQDFVAQLLDSHLMISFFSTTVAQALQCGRPVLLWGATQRCIQVDARTTPPAQSDRAAVYAVHHAGDLRAMIEAIRDAHSGRPLQSAEIAPYAMGPSAKSVTEIATALRTRLETLQAG